MKPRSKEEREVDSRPTVEPALVLAQWRKTGDRKSAEVCVMGEQILMSPGGLQGLKDEVWPFLEQLALAAMDCGKAGLAKVRSELFRCH